MSILNCNLILQVKVGGVIPKFSGVMARGIFLNIIREYSEEFSDTLHNNTNIQKYSISEFKYTTLNFEYPFNLHSSKKHRKNNRKDNILLPGEFVKIRIISADSNLNSKLPLILQNDWYAKKDSLVLTPYLFQCKDISDTDFVLTQNPINVKFTSPVAFSRGSNVVIFPEIEYIMKNLVSIWNVWNPHKQITTEKQTNLLNSSYITYATGRVISIPNGKGASHRGWVGKVSYKFTEAESYKIGASLLKFGTYSGAGRGRSAGFGRFIIIK